MSVIPHPNLDRASAEETLEYVVERFHPRLYVACSFQKEASVIMDMLLRVEPSARFFTLDTDLLFEETYETKRKLEERYDIEVDVYKGISLAEQRELHGPELWKAAPLADWTDAQVWSYIDKFDVPYNPLHDRGYESIGCTHCTLPSTGRDGRWADVSKTECGLHG